MAKKKTHLTDEDRLQIEILLTVHISGKYSSNIAVIVFLTALPRFIALTRALLKPRKSPYSSVSGKLCRT